jgi:hypothetical protein
MDCPGCGSQSSTDQNNCRACGLNLEGLSGVASSDGLELARKQHKELLIHGMMRLLGAGGIVLLVGLVLFIVDRKLIHDTAIELSAFLTMLLGLSIMAFGMISSLSYASNKTSVRRNLSARGKLATAETRRLSPGGQSARGQAR